MNFHSFLVSFTLYIFSCCTIGTLFFLPSDCGISRIFTFSRSLFTQSKRWIWFSVDACVNKQRSVKSFVKQRLKFHRPWNLRFNPIDIQRNYKRMKKKLNPIRPLRDQGGTTRESFSDQAVSVQKFSTRRSCFPREKISTAVGPPSALHQISVTSLFHPCQAPKARCSGFSSQAEFPRFGGNSCTRA